MHLVNISSYISDIIFLLMIAGMPLYGYIKKIQVFDSFIVGAKDGFSLIIKLLPFLVGMIFAIGMLRACGVIEFLGDNLGYMLEYIGAPAEILPLMISRPFSGSASNAILVDLINTHGPDSLIAITAATLMGSTETTFYVVAVYFGSIGIKNTKYAIPAGLFADAVGMLAAVWISHYLFL
jgi:spore maturation protein B